MEDKTPSQAQTPLIGGLVILLVTAGKLGLDALVHGISARHLRMDLIFLAAEIACFVVLWLLARAVDKGSE